MQILIGSLLKLTKCLFTAVVCFHPKKALNKVITNTESLRTTYKCEKQIDRAIKCEIARFSELVLISSLFSLPCALSLLLVSHMALYRV